MHDRILNDITLPWIGMELGDELGYGTFGTVYKVEMDGETFALKHIKIPQDDNEAANLLRTMKEEAKVKDYYHGVLDDFLNEIRTMQNLRDNPHIVSIRDYRIREQGLGYELYILMELLTSFEDYEIEHMIGEKEAIDIGLDICEALEECEKQHIVHRDLKPDNILFDQEGRCKIGDFGEAKNMERTVSSISVRGTFSFMAPEVYHGKSYDQRADIYSTGLILHRFVNRGHEPFVDVEKQIVHFKDKEEAVNRRMKGEPIPAPVDASEEFAQIIQKATAYYPEKRYASAAAMKADLKRLKEGKFKKRNTSTVRYGKRTKGFYIRAAAAITLILAAAFFSYRYYQTNIVNLCDEDVKRKIREECGDDINLTSRLNGDGVLYIDSNDDVKSLDEYSYDSLIETYPWEAHQDEIREIVFGKNVTVINAAFDCKNLKRISINSSEIDFGSRVFSNCKDLASVTISDNIHVIGGIFLDGYDNPFEGCKFIEDNKDKYVALGNVLLRYNGDQEVVDDIPENISVIGSQCFSGKNSLKKIVLPDAVEAIGSEAFLSCDSLEEVTVPASLNINDIKSDAFGYFDYDDRSKCTKSEFFIWGGFLFRYNGSDAVVEVPEGVKKIGSFAFSENESIKKILLPDSVRLFDDYNVEGLFDGCKFLSEISAPKNLDYSTVNAKNFKDTQMYRNAIDNEGYFIYGTKLLDYVKQGKPITSFPDLKNKICHIGDETFDKNPDVKSLRIPDTVEDIGYEAFSECENLESVYIPKSVKFIDYNAFSDCPKLKKVEFEDPTILANNGFGEKDEYGDEPTLADIFDGTPWLKEYNKAHGIPESE